MAKCEKILIAGFSGSGKSSFLRALAADSPFGWDQFADLDDLIQKKALMDVGGFIQSEGIEKFRALESVTLAEWLKSARHGVLALGGGTLTREIYASLKLMKDVRIVFLHSEFDLCWKRVNQKNEPLRPLAKKGKEEFHKIYLEREPIFDLIPWRLENQEATALPSLAKNFWTTVLTSY